MANTAVMSQGCRATACPASRVAVKIRHLSSALVWLPNLVLIAAL
jgi:hypothetical protein